MKIIFVGGGKILYFLARTFISKGHDVVIINRERCDCEDLTRRLEAMVLCGDGSDPKILTAAGAEEADVVVALTPYDPENLMICKLAEIRFQVPRTFALVNDPALEDAFHKLGVTRAFSTTSIVSSLIEQKISADSIISLIPLENGRITVTQVKLDHNSPAVEKEIKALCLPKQAILSCIIRNEEEIIIPRGETVLKEADRVIVIALPKSMGKVMETLLGPE